MVTVIWGLSVPHAAAQAACAAAERQRAAGSLSASEPRAKLWPGTYLKPMFIECVSSHCCVCRAYYATGPQVEHRVPASWASTLRRNTVASFKLRFGRIIRIER